MLRPRWSLAAEIAVRYHLAFEWIDSWARHTSRFRCGGDGCGWRSMSTVLGPPVLGGDRLLVGFAHRRVSGSGSSSGGTSGWPGINRGTLLAEEKGEFVNLQGEPDEGRPGRGRPGGVYIIVAAIAAIAIIVLLIILIF